MVAYNDTNKAETIGVGMSYGHFYGVSCWVCIGFFTRLDRQPTQTLVFERVEYDIFFYPHYLPWQSIVYSPGSLVQCEFTPILGGYIISGHKENAVLRGQIATPLLFKENLVELPAYTNWRIEYKNGEYNITRDFMDVGEDAWDGLGLPCLPGWRSFLSSLVISHFITGCITVYLFTR